MNKRIQNEIKRATEFGARAEALVVEKGQCPAGERNNLLLAYWSLVFEFHKAILHLIDTSFFGAAAALLRPTIETTIRAHIVISGPDDVLKQLLADKYKTNFATVGQEIDKEFGMDGFVEHFLNNSKEALHGYTHAGMHQLGRRFTGTDLTPNYSDDELVEVIRVSTSAVFMVNNVLTGHFGFEEEWKENTRLYDEWGHPS